MWAQLGLTMKPLLSVSCRAVTNTEGKNRTTHTRGHTQYREATLPKFKRAQMLTLKINSVVNFPSQVCEYQDSANIRTEQKQKGNQGILPCLSSRATVPVHQPESQRRCVCENTVLSCTQVFGDGKLKVLERNQILSFSCKPFLNS